MNVLSGPDEEKKMKRVVTMSQYKIYMMGHLTSQYTMLNPVRIFK